MMMPRQGQSRDSYLQELDRRSSEDHYRRIQNVMRWNEDLLNAQDRARAQLIISQRLEFKSKD